MIFPSRFLAQSLKRCCLKKIPQGTLKTPLKWMRMGLAGRENNFHRQRELFSLKNPFRVTLHGPLSSTSFFCPYGHFLLPSTAFLCLISSYSLFELQLFLPA